jgi:hypothetical protein
MPREPAQRQRAQREAREAKERLEAEHEADAVAEGDEEPPQSLEPEPNVVHVIVNRAEDGTVSIGDVVATGDIRVTEISDLLTLGRKHWREKAGLDS